ncbi:MAG: response regulator, partial [Pseudomonadota bacterium]
MARAKRILLVDDDELLRSTLLDQFELSDEFDVACAATGHEAIETAKEEAHIDLMLLDVGLPDMDGREACRIMRKNGFKSPIIMLTGADSEAD